MGQPNYQSNEDQNKENNNKDKNVPISSGAPTNTTTGDSPMYN